MQSQRPKNSAIDQKEKKIISSGLQSLFMMFMGALITVMIGVFLYLSPIFNKNTTKPVADGGVQAPAIIELSPDKNETMGVYEFYEILPKQQFESHAEDLAVSHNRNLDNQVLAKVDAVVLGDEIDQGESMMAGTNSSMDNISVTTENITYDDSIHIQHTQPKTTYVLQVRSFDDSDEADDLRTEVMMAGVEARVIKKHTTDNTVLYQVVSTAFNNKDDATNAYERLKNHGVDSLIVEQRSQP